MDVCCRYGGSNPLGHSQLTTLMGVQSLLEIVTLKLQLVHFGE
jgi:hypothetical protein